MYLYMCITKVVDEVVKQSCPTYTFGNNLQEEVTDPNILHCIFRNPLQADGIL